MISEKNILKLKVREKIYAFINKNPGLTIKEMSRKMNIPVTTLRYHIRYLKRYDLIEDGYLGKYKRIYLKQIFSEKEKKVIALLRKETPRNIFLHFLFSVTCTKTELSKELQLNTATISYHIKAFINLGILEEAPISNGIIHPLKNHKIFIHKRKKNEVYYRRSDNNFTKIMYKILIDNKKGLSNSEYIDAFDYWFSQFPKVNDKSKSIDSNIEDFIELFYEVFPEPFIA